MKRPAHRARDERAETPTHTKDDSPKSYTAQVGATRGETMAVDHERRIDRIERIIEIYEDRLTAGSKTMATHEIRLANLEEYQAKQNGHLKRIENKLDGFCDQVRADRWVDRKEEDARWTKITWLLVSVLVSVVTLLLRGVF